MANVEVVHTGENDKDVAAELRKRMGVLLEPVCALLDEANRRGMRITFNLGHNGLRNSVVALEVIKPL